MFYNKLVWIWISYIHICLTWITVKFLYNASYFQIDEQTDNTGHDNTLQSEWTESNETIRAKHIPYLIDKIELWDAYFIWYHYTNRKWQDYVYIQSEYKSTKQKIKHLLREENKVKENKIS